MDAAIELALSAAFFTEKVQRWFAFAAISWGHLTFLPGIIDQRDCYSLPSPNQRKHGAVTTHSLVVESCDSRCSLAMGTGTLVTLQVVHLELEANEANEAK